MRPPQNSSANIAPTSTYGLGLALLASWMWATIPIILKVLIGDLDPVTLTWARFLTAGLLICPLVLRNRSLAALFRLRGSRLIAVVVAILALCSNYVTFLWGLKFVSPGTAQVLMQTTPMMALVGSLWLFGERLGGYQWLGFLLLAIGQILFFSPRQEELLSLSGNYVLGVALVFVSAVFWTIYMMCQKHLSADLSPEASVFVIYAVGSLLLLPLTQPTMILELGTSIFVLLIISGATTMISYYLFAKSLQHAEASRVGIIVALMPIFTVGGMVCLTATFPGLLEPEQLESETIAGALMVVAGVMLGALGNRSTETGRLHQGGRLQEGQLQA